jgi:hypothetical protein
VPDAQLESINSLMSRAQYPAIDRNWNLHPSPVRLLDGGEPSSCSLCEDIFREIIQPIAVRVGGIGVHDRPDDVWTLHIEDATPSCCDAWRIDFDKGTIERTGGELQNWRLMSSMAALRSLNRGDLNPSIALERGELRLVRVTEEDTQAEQRELTQPRFIALIKMLTSPGRPPARTPNLATPTK